MKRTFLAQRNALLSRASLSWGLVALIFAMSALVVRLLLPNVFWQLASPAFRAGDALAAVNHTFLSSFNDAAALTQANERLTRENEALSAENQALVQKVASVLVLGDLSEASGEGVGIIAGVVARPPVSAYDILVVAQGTSAGVTEGMEAFGPGGVPLGMVGATSADFAQIILFSSPRMSTAGWIGKGMAPLTMLGAGGGALEASIARAAGVVVGDTVFVPGPGALPIGVVRSIDGDPSSPSVTLQIEPLLNLFSVAWVELRATGHASFSSLLTATSTRP